MFARVLLDDGEWRFTADWLGLGRLQVTHWPTQRTAVASRQLRAYFLAVMEQLRANGVELAADSPPFQIAARAMARIILDPASLPSRAMLLDPPEVFAERAVLGIE